jgi:hypothetical protein
MLMAMSLDDIENINSYVKLCRSYPKLTVKVVPVAVQIRVKASNPGAIVSHTTGLPELNLPRAWIFIDTETPSQD